MAAKALRREQASMYLLGAGSAVPGPALGWLIPGNVSIK